MAERHGNEVRGAEEYRKEGFLITTERDRMDAAVLQEFLSNSYWARGIPLSVVEKFIQNSLCFGVFEDRGLGGDAQIGFARVITDYATFGYLGDVFILDSHRGQGLGKWLMECVMAHRRLQGFRKWVLVTQDAHGLYAHHGFQPLASPEGYMEISDLDIYLRDES